MRASNNTFQRVEKKYLLTEKQCQQLLEQAQDKLMLDEYGLHTIHNIYYDTEDYELIRTSLEKPRYKEKFRVRGYGEVQNSSPVFLEIKKKYKGIVYKRRESMPLAAAAAYLADGMLPENASQIMKEIHYFLRFYQPLPKKYIAYDRRAFFGTEDSTLRLTIDQNIRSRNHDLALRSSPEDSLLLEEDQRLMEIKVAGAYPLWLARLLSELEIYPVSFSKYGRIYTKELGGEKLCSTVS